MQYMEAKCKFESGQRRLVTLPWCGGGYRNGFELLKKAKTGHRDADEGAAERIAGYLHTGYLHGCGVKKDEKKGLRLILSAAREGDPGAPSNSR